MQECASKVTFSFDANLMSVFEKGFDFDFFGATNHAIDFGYREATFLLFNDFTFGFDDFGVDESSEGIIFLVVEIITDNDDALVDSHLGGGHSGRELVGVCLFPVK